MLSKNKPVIVGHIATGSSDVVATPIGRFPGLLTQATTIGNILTQRHLKFFPVWLQIVSVGLIGVFLAVMFSIRSSWGILAVSVAAPGWLFGSSLFPGTVGLDDSGVAGH